MSVDMYLSASKSQASSASSLCKKQIEGYNDVQKAISDFVGNAPDLKGKAYDSGKAYFNTVLLPLAKGGILLSEAVEKAVKKFPEDYVAKVDSGDLKQSELEERIRDVNNLLSQAQSTRDRINSSKTPDMSKGYQLNANSMLINAYSAQKQKLQEKLNKLLEFNATSPQIFSEIAGLQSSVEQGLAQTKDSWNASNETFNIPSAKDLEWTNRINKDYDEKEVNRISALFPDKVTPKDLMTIAEIQKRNPDISLPEKVWVVLKKNLGKYADDVSGIGLDSVIEATNNFVDFNALGEIVTGGGSGLTSFGLANINNASMNTGLASSYAAGQMIKNVGLPVVGFSVGMFSDSSQGATLGQAVAHNGSVTLTATWLTAGGTILLGSNPAGWAVAGVAIGSGFIASKMYDSNFLGIKDMSDEWAKNFDRNLDKINKGINNIGQSVSKKFDDFVSNFGW